MKKITVEDARSLAQFQLNQYMLRRAVIIESSPLKTLATFPWSEFIEGNYGQRELLALNRELDLRSCLGRVAFGLALCGFHPYDGEDVNEPYRFGEVHRDWFRDELLKQWKSVYGSGAKIPPASWLDELIMYEDPHGIIMVGGVQFDPLTTLMPEDRDVRHPEVADFKAWEAVASAMVVSQALAEADPLPCLDLLDQAEGLCPSTCLVAQNRVFPLVRLERYEEAKGLLMRLADIRPTARGFFVLEQLFDVFHPKRPSLYDDKLWGLIKGRLEKEVVL